MSRYVILSPVHNEEDYIEKTIGSVISQKIKPIEWIIINDGSTDRTKQIVQKYSLEFPWIKIVDRPRRGYRPGGGVVEAFYDGFSNIKNKDYDFIVKLDGDISFEESYFEEIFKRFSENPRLGIASGNTFCLDKGKLVLEDCHEDHTRGASKVYRKKCFEQIGGLKSTLGWDIIDELQAQMFEWQTKNYRELVIVHHRKMGSRGGISKGNFRSGYTAYKIGYHPLYMVLRSIYRMIDRPYIVGGVVLFYGYLKAALNKENLIIDQESVAFLRKKQLKRLANILKFRH